MKKTKWWLRIVGAFYLLLTALNAYYFFFNQQGYRDILPFRADDIAIRAFIDAWMVFIFELAVLGVMALYASRNPGQGRILVITIILAEIFRGAVADAIWIYRGYSAAEYVPFIFVHLIIVVTGIIFLRQERTVNGGAK